MDLTIESHLRGFSEKHLPPYLNKFLKYNWVINLIGRIMCFKRVNELLHKFRESSGTEMVEDLIETLGLSVSYENLDKIPASGRILIIANHPLGGTDILTMLHGISKVRKDVKLVINKEVLRLLSNMEDLFIPVDMHAGSNEGVRNKIVEHLENEEAVIILPSGAISVMTLNGLRDLRWKNGVSHFSRDNNTNILPVFIGGRFHLRFYMYPKIVRRFLLVKKFLYPRKQDINIVIGDPISYKDLNTKKDTGAITAFLREKVYEIDTLLRLKHRTA